MDFSRVAEQPDTTTHARAEELAKRGTKVSHVSVWSLLGRAKQSHKKDLDRQRVGSSGRRPSAPPMARAKHPSIPGDGFSSMKRGQRQTSYRSDAGVVMDNLGSQKTRAVREAIRSANTHRIFLPAYSPDLIPIEQMFAKLKALLRKA